MFEENKVIMVACGTMHVVVLTHDSPDSKIPELEEKVMELPPLEVVTPKKVSVKAKVEKEPKVEVPQAVVM